MLIDIIDSLFTMKPFIETSFIFQRNVNYCLVNSQVNSSLPAWERYKRQKVNNKLEKRCYFTTINRDYDGIRVSAISKEQEAGSDWIIPIRCRMSAFCVLRWGTYTNLYDTGLCSRRSFCVSISTRSRSWRSEPNYAQWHQTKKNKNVITAASFCRLNELLRLMKMIDLYDR